MMLQKIKGVELLLFFVLFIFLSIPMVLEARTTHRKVYRVCLANQKAFYNADLDRTECCDSEPQKDKNGNYYCLDDKCFSDEDCPENSICVLPMQQCVSCVEGATTYCSLRGDVLIRGEQYSGCLEAGCSFSNCQQVWYSEDTTRGYCCSENSYPYCHYEDEQGECTGFSCCSNEGGVYFYGPENGKKRYECCSQENLASFDEAAVCCNSTQKAYCSSYDENGKCVAAGCCSLGTATMDEMSTVCSKYNENGLCVSQSCCAGAPYHASSNSLNETCCAFPKVVSEPFEGGMQACCAADQTPYCRSYDENGICTAVACCNDGAQPRCSKWSNGVCLTYTCCSAGGVPYCDDLTDGVCTSSNCCYGTVYETVSGHSACCQSDWVLSEIEGSSVCCRVGETPYKIEDRAGCCVGTPYLQEKSPTNIACCPADQLLATFDDVQVCYPEGATPFCYKYENDKCIRGLYRSNTICTPYRISATEGGCCETSSEIIPNGAYFMCTETSTSNCEEGEIPYQSSSYRQSCCPTKNGWSVTDSFDGIQECCAPDTFAICSVKDDAGMCLDVGCCESDAEVYQKDQNGSIGCCYGVVSGNFDGLQGCCSVGQTPYCSSYDKKGKCSYVACCDGTIFRNSQGGESCCRGVVSGNFNGVQGCCSSPDQQTFCSSYDENGVCQSVGCCAIGYQRYCSQYYSAGKCYAENCCSGEIYTNLLGHQACCSSSNIVSNVAGVDGVLGCCPSGQEPYCYMSEGKCSSVSCCNGALYKKSVSSSTQCCPYSSVVSEDFDGLQGCCSAGQTAYCSSTDENGVCQTVSCCSSVVSEKFDGLQGCFSKGLIPYCSSKKNGICRSVSACSFELVCNQYDNQGNCVNETCCNGTLYKATQTALGKACCPPSQVVSGNFDGLEVCHSPGYTPYCRTYDENNQCIQTGSCQPGYAGYRQGEAYGGRCCNASRIRDVGNGYQVCLPSDQYIAYCQQYNAQGECILGSYCSASLQPYRVSQTTGSCCDRSSLTERFDGIQGCNTSGKKYRAYCSEYVNGRCNKIAYSYIAGGCIPYRISATKGGCCVGTVVKNGDYEMCI